MLSPSLANELRSITMETIRRKNQRSDETLEKSGVFEAKIDDFAKAEEILSFIPDKARRAAMEGHRSCDVMDVFPIDSKLVALDVGEVARIVFRKLQSVGLNPKLRISRIDNQPHVMMISW